MGEMVVTADSWWVAPGVEVIDRVAAERGIERVVAAGELLAQRERWLGAVAADPYRLGWEPSIWWVGWALLDVKWVAEGTRRTLAERLGVEEVRAWEVWKERIRGALGVAEALQDLLVMGANRCAKSEFGAKSTQTMAVNLEKETVLFLAQQYAVSASTVQPRLWRYMPKEWKRKYMGDDWYVNYKDLKGFSEAQYQLPSGSKVLGKFYSQDPHDALIGCEAAWAWADELIPLNWFEELGRRLASRRGKMVLTFTPIEGYTAVVRDFLDGARVVRTAPGYLLPRDGGEQLVHAAVGLTREEMERREWELKRGVAPTVPGSRPEDCVGWLEDGGRCGVVAEAAGRVFEEVPRVALCEDGRRGVVWFHTRDNPYGEPLELIARERGKGVERIRTVLYGIATKSRASVLARYNEEVHVVGDGEVPEVGVNYCIADPAGARNDTLIWVRSTPEADYIYREWPGSYNIPGVGVPGPWAVVSGRRGGENDGALGEGSESFGFGFLRMKVEVARLEGWRDYVAWAGGELGVDVEEGVVLPGEDVVRGWSEENGAREVVAERFMDSRAAARKQMTVEGEVSLQECWNELGGWSWMTAPGGVISSGLAMIADGLDYGVGGDGVVEVAPKLFVAESCRNVRFAMANYTGADGQKGAVKDWIDLVRYFYELGLGRCGGVDGVEVGRVFGSGARGAAEMQAVKRARAGGGVKVGSEVVRGGEAAGVPGSGRPRAGGRMGGGGGGARVVWRVGR